uniref:DUF7903 domain-containing protein n=1 Tax=Solanum lycopersicum TaxID=4081 RepID=A0A3Q7G4I2_SOLLC
MEEELKPSVVACLEEFSLMVGKLGLEYVKEKELYYVKLSDNMHTDLTVTSKCMAVKDQEKIQLHKVNQGCRHELSWQKLRPEVDATC